MSEKLLFHRLLKSYMPLTVTSCCCLKTSFTEMQEGEVARLSFRQVRELDVKQSVLFHFLGHKIIRFL